MALGDVMKQIYMKKAPTTTFLCLAGHALETRTEEETREKQAMSVELVPLRGGPHIPFRTTGLPPPIPRQLKPKSLPLRGVVIVTVIYPHNWKF